MKIEDASPELIEKAKACETPEELFELAKKKVFEMTGLAEAFIIER